MAHTEFQKTHKVTLGCLNQDINAAIFVGDVFSMARAHHAAVIFDVGVLSEDVVCSIYQGHKIHPIVAATAGGAEAGNLSIAGDYASMFTVGLFLVVHGSTGNDGFYTVDAAAAAYAGGVTTIEVDEAVASAVGDGYLTLVKAFTVAKAVTYTSTDHSRVGILEVEASELDLANGYRSIVAHLYCAAANAGYVGAVVIRTPLRHEPASLVT